MKLTFLVGAGISVPSPSSLPMFPELRDGLLHGALPNRPLRTTDDPAPEHIFYSATRSERSKRDVTAYIARSLDGFEPNWNHRFLVAMLQRGHTVWTPNFDTLIERAGWNGPVAAWDEPAPSTTGGVLFKPHGTLRDSVAPEDQRLIFRSSDTTRPMPADWQDTFVQSCDGACLIVWGYRGRDVDLMPMVKRVSTSSDLRWLTAVPEEAQDVSRQLGRTIAPFPDFISIRRHLRDDIGATESWHDAIAVGDDFDPGSTTRPRRDLIGPSLDPASAATLASEYDSPSRARRILAGGVVRGPDRRDNAALLIRSALHDTTTWRRLLRPVVHIAVRTPRVGHSSAVESIWLTVLDVDGPGRHDQQRLEQLLLRRGRAPYSPEASEGWQLYSLVRTLTLLRSVGAVEPAQRYLEQHGVQLLDAVSQHHNTLVGNVLFESSELARLTGDLGGSASAIARYDDVWRKLLPPRWAALLELERGYLHVCRGEADQADHILSAAIDAERRLPDVSKGTMTIADLDIARFLARSIDRMSTGARASVEPLALDRRTATPNRQAIVALIEGELCRVDGRDTIARAHFAAALRSPSRLHHDLATLGLAMTPPGNAKAPAGLGVWAVPLAPSGRPASVPEFVADATDLVRPGARPVLVLPVL